MAALPAPMQRHEALQDLSRDHHHGLVMARDLCQAAAGQGDGLDEVSRRFLGFWDDELAEHFREEEEVLLPIYGRYINIADDQLVGRMLQDHAWFRDQVAELRTRLQSGDPHGSIVAELGERLDEHARFEERELFPTIEDTLTDEDLALVSVRSREYRVTHRGPDQIGPRTSRKDPTGP